MGRTQGMALCVTKGYDPFVTFKAMFTGPTEARPQNLAPGLVMASDHKPALIAATAAAVAACAAILFAKRK